MESNNRLYSYTKLYDKRDDFYFHIINFPFLSSNIPSSPSYGVYISQLIRYARCCLYYDDFGYRHKLLVDRLLSQGFEVKCLRNSFNPITYGGGGGGLFGPDHQIIDHNSKTALSSTSKLGDFLFLSIRHTLAEF